MATCVLYSAMRRNSERLPDKLMRGIWTPKGWMTLAQWSAVRLKAIANQTRLPYYLLASMDELPWIDHEYPVIDRSCKSLAAEKMTEVYQDVPPYFDLFDWAIHINACCPLIQTRTIIAFVDEVLTSFDPQCGYYVQGAFEETGFVYKDNRRIFPAGDDPLWLNTKINDTFHTPCHALAAYPAKSLGRKEVGVGGIVNVGRRTSEFVDIDTLDDYDLACAISSWKYRRAVAGPE